MRVLVVGAGGFIGRHLVGRLVVEGLQVVAAGREPKSLSRRLAGVETIACDLARDDRAQWAERLRGVDAIVNCAGIIGRGADYAGVHEHGATALFDAALAAGVGRVIQVSALGADHTGVTPYHRSKRAADDYLARLGADGTVMGWAVVRPSLVLGRGGASMALFAALAALPIVPRLGTGQWQVQPIHVDDLVDILLRLLRAPAPLHHRLDAVGPEPMTTDELTAVIRRWLGRGRAPQLAVPRNLLALAARLGIGPATPESLAMLEAGNTAPMAHLLEATEGRPSPVEQMLALHPATAADVAAARLAPVIPVARWLLALVWLAGGLVSIGAAPGFAIDAWLAKLGLGGAAAFAVLWAGSLADIAVGLAIAARRHGAALAGVALMGVYTAILTTIAPELWADPFGPLVKNLAVLGLSLVVHVLEMRRG
ncbi:SDR family oxidoreductase [Novosphingobium aerophilum]|uniref:SDR family oxidoreductase n=1 Tax=Novosphingobium TaxID=165696 RepID=UPI002D782ADF|nr:SDR family oxidoreductase [Novosphingobium sp. RL4]WRT95790.1 SDR family oxidoreductase [Novosphingobium sp. RL4]